jgi:hypothetical protein
LIEAELMAARLLHEGTVRLDRFPNFLVLREDVDRLLRPVGFQTVTHVASDYVGLRPTAELSEREGFDTATNLGLPQDAHALLTILWARLVLPTRRQSENGGMGLNGKPAEKTRTPENAIVHEHKKTFGSASRVRMLLGLVVRHGFVVRARGYIEAGPLLELALDGESMRAFVQGELFAKIAAAGEDGSEADVMTPDEVRVVDAVDRSGEGGVATRDLIATTGLQSYQVRRILRDLQDTDHVRRHGKGQRTRYVSTRHTVAKEAK